MRIKFLHLLFSLLLFIFSDSNSFAALTGAYTIDATAAASQTNYTSFSALFLDLRHGYRSDSASANGPGMNGAVFVHVAKGSGPYRESVYIDSIVGSSEVNRLVIYGNGETVLSDQNDQLAPNAFLLDNAGNIEFHNLQFQYDDIQGGKNITMAGNVKNILIKDCSFKQTMNHAQSSGTAFIAITNSLSSLSPGGANARNIRIVGNRMGNNHLVGVDHAIYLGYYPKDSLDRNIVISNNFIEDFKNAAIVCHGTKDIQIISNRIQNNFVTPGIGRLPIAITMFNHDYILKIRIDSNTIRNIKHDNTFNLNAIEVYGTNSTVEGLSIQHNTLDLNPVNGSVTALYVDLSRAHITSDVLVAQNNIDVASYEVRRVNTGILMNMQASSGGGLVNCIANHVSMLSTAFSVNGIRYLAAQSTYKGERFLHNNVVSVRGLGSSTAMLITANNNDILRIYHNTLSTDDLASKTPTSFGVRLLLVQGGAADVVNNIFYANYASGSVVAMVFTGIGFDIDHNCIYLDAKNGATTIYASGNPLNGNANTYEDFMEHYSSGNDINVDPKFIDISSDDFIPTSEALKEAAFAASWITYDIDGNPRDENKPDIGAYEFSATSAVTNRATSKLSEFACWPNPATDRLSLIRRDYAQSWLVTIYNSNGQPVQNIEFTDGLDYISIPLIDLPSGFYVVRAGTEQVHHSRKLLIVR